MSKLLINQSTLSSIGDAIRTKGGTTDPIPVVGLADAILALDGTALPPYSYLILTVSGFADSFNENGIWDSAMASNDNTFIFNDVESAENMFYNSSLTTIPNIDLNNCQSIYSIFDGCVNLTTAPTFTGGAQVWDDSYVVEGVLDIEYMFNDCHNLRTIPTDYIDKFFTEGMAQYGKLSYDLRPGSVYSVFGNCYSLRQACDLSSILTGDTNSTYYDSVKHKECYKNCYVLDEIVNHPTPRYTNLTQSDSFKDFVLNCYRLKKLTFFSDKYVSDIGGQNAGSSYGYTVRDVRWSNQTIDLSTVGFGPVEAILGYNSGITADKEVKDASTYTALKNDPDWFTQDVAYSRYDKASALETINSLPNASTYLSSVGGTNTIKFRGEAGSKTNGGAINTLSENTIAIAASKGWTVAFV